MSQRQQLLNPFTARGEARPRVDQVGAGSGELSGESAIRHDSMVAGPAASKEVQTPEKSLSNALQMLEGWLCRGVREAGLTHGQVCAHIGNGRGGTYDQSQWTKARATGDLPMGRMLAGLPLAFWRPIAIELATACGLKVSDVDSADVAFERTAVAFEAAADAFRQMRRTA